MMPVNCDRMPEQKQGELSSPIRNMPRSKDRFVCKEMKAGLSTHLAGGAVEVHPTGLAALLRSSGRGEGAVAGVGIGLGSGCRRWLHLLGGAIHAEPVTAACPHSTCQGKHCHTCQGHSWGDNKAGNAHQLPTHCSFLAARFAALILPMTSAHKSRTPSPALVRRDKWRSRELYY